MIIPILPKHCKAILRYLICGPVSVAFRLMFTDSLVSCKMWAQAREITGQPVPFTLIKDGTGHLALRSSRLSSGHTISSHKPGTLHAKMFALACCTGRLQSHAVLRNYSWQVDRVDLQLTSASSCRGRTALDRASSPATISVFGVVIRLKSAHSDSRCSTCSAARTCHTLRP